MLLSRALRWWRASLILLRSYGRDNTLHVCWAGSVRNRAVNPYVVVGSHVMGVHACNRATGSHGGGLFARYSVGLFLVPLVLIYIFAFGAVVYGRRRLTQGLPVSYQARMGVFRNSARYVLVYIVYVLCAPLAFGTCLPNHDRSVGLQILDHRGHCVCADVLDERVNSTMANCCVGGGHRRPWPSHVVRVAVDARYSGGY